MVLGFKLKNILLGSSVVIFLVIIGVLISQKTQSSTDRNIEVRVGDFIKEVSVSGKIVPTESVTLAFSDTGRVSILNTRVGDRVKKGQELGSLQTNILISELQSARATLALKQAQSENIQTNIEQVEKTQNTLVENARIKLLSDGLTAIQSSENTTLTNPIITGRYRGSEGRYKIIIRRSELNTNDAELFTFELETTRKVKILDNEPTMLGTRGLFVSFPDDVRNYWDTIWYITIPNVKSSVYLDNTNTYQETLRIKDSEISKASAELAQNIVGTNISQAEILKALADINRIQAAIAERTIYAPFNGIVTKIDIKPGETASTNQSVISLISDNALQIESFIPEIHTPFIKIGDIAKVTLDAYGSDKSFVAKVISLDPAETIKDGVSTYRAKLEFTETDDKVKPGMTANVVITTENKTGVLSIPVGAVITRNGRKFVKINADEKISEREVTVGNVSSLGQIEILSGLDEGNIIVTPEEE